MALPHTNNAGVPALLWVRTIKTLLVLCEPLADTCTAPHFSLFSVWDSTIVQENESVLMRMCNVKILIDALSNKSCEVRILRPSVGLVSKSSYNHGRLYRYFVKSDCRCPIIDGVRKWIMRTLLF